MRKGVLPVFEPGDLKRRAIDQKSEAASVDAPLIRTAHGLERLIRAMQNALTKRHLITAILSWAALYGCIFIVNWLSPKACSTDFWPPSIHCRWDL